MTFDWSEPFFIGFAQAKQKNWKIKKGSKSTWLRWGGTILKKEEDPETGKSKEFFQSAAKWHGVFNISCIDDSQSAEKVADYVPKVKAGNINRSPRIKEAELLIETQQAEVKFGGDSACYVPKLDKINMPHYEDFSDNFSFYATFIHELIHRTGHPSRLNRDLSGKQGSFKYAKEELIAELGATFVCNELFLDYKLENHASYLKAYLSLLKDDNKAFFNAAASARKASNLLFTNAGLEVTAN